MNYKYADPIGRKLDMNNRGMITIGFDAGTNTYSGDYSKSDIRPKTSFLIGTALNHYFNLDLEVGYRGLNVQKKVDDYSYFGDASLRYVFLPYEKLTPFCSLGAGVDQNHLGVGLSGENYFPKINGKFGLEYMVNNNMGFNVSTGVNYYLNDKIDGTHAGSYNDLGWGVSLGVKFYMIKMKHK